MQIRYSANRAEVLAPAKINLFFEVLSRRDDGFHEIETLMAPIRLFDSLVLEDDSTGHVTLQVSWSTGFTTQRSVSAERLTGDDFETLPEGDENIVVRAIRMLAQAAGVRRGAKLRLVKRIPMAAGLGGGSSDAAAALVAANLVWKLGWSNERLTTVAVQLGSDVPFFLGRGPAVCRGRGEKIEPVAGLGALHLVVVCPPEGLSTAAVYRACEPGGPPRLVGTVVSALQRRELPVLGPVAYNGLLPAAQQLSPSVGRVLDRLKQVACPVIGMSGSGSSCFAVVRNKAEAQRLARRLHAERLGRVWSVRST